MKMDMKNLTSFNDCLRYSLDPLAKVLLIKLIGVMNIRGNAYINWYYREVYGLARLIF